MALVSTILTLARSLQLKTIAEGVEPDTQEKALRLLRCDAMQGYLFSRPVPPLNSQHSSRDIAAVPSSRLVHRVPPSSA